MRKAKRRAGFTLVELIVVIAIILVLAAALVPSLMRYIERSREIIDLSNVREAYESIMLDMSEYGSAEDITVELKQGRDGWQSSLPLTIAGVTYDGTETDQWIGTPKAGGVCTVRFDTELQGAVFIWGDGSDSSPVDPTQDTISAPVFDAIERFLSGTVNPTLQTSSNNNQYARLRYSQTRINGNTSNSRDAYGQVVAQRLVLDEEAGTYRVNVGDSNTGSMSGLAQELLKAVKSDAAVTAAFADPDQIRINYIEVTLSGDGQLKHDRVDSLDGYQLIEQTGDDSYTVYTRKGDTWTVESGTKEEMLASENAYNAS